MPRQDEDFRHDADIVLRCPDPQAVMAAYVDELGFRLDLIYPADDPRVLLLSGHGLSVCLVREAPAMPLEEPSASSIDITEPSNASWIEGRAGMQYRDLIPGRAGGRYIASHIRIPVGGPVADYVHFHDVRFQLIYCYKGWVRVVYEDQGDPFVMQAGDCILQPPGIRHRVLECGPGMEVIEVACPAEHRTHVDHDLLLPTATRNTARSFSGQRFVRFKSGAGKATPSKLPGVSETDTGLAAASSGEVSAIVLSFATGNDAVTFTVGTEFWFLFVLDGDCAVVFDDESPRLLRPGAALSAPAHSRVALSSMSANLSALLVTSPARSGSCNA